MRLGCLGKLPSTRLTHKPTGLTDPITHRLEVSEPGRAAAPAEGRHSGVTRWTSRRQQEEPRSSPRCQRQIRRLMSHVTRALCVFPRAPSLLLPFQSQRWELGPKMAHLKGSNQQKHIFFLLYKVVNGELKVCNMGTSMCTEMQSFPPASTTPSVKRSEKEVQEIAFLSLLL